MVQSLLKFIICIVLFNHSSYGQLEKTYETSKYLINYPSTWLISTHDSSIINLYPKEEYGAITFSYRSHLELPMAETQKFIIDMNETNDNPANVKVIQKDNLTEYYYECYHKNVKWLTKVIRKQNEFYILTSNCMESRWLKERDTFLKVFNSFKVK
jgi:hypothetical protein